MTRTTAQEFDAIFSLLSDTRRRFLLYQLLETEYAAVDGLARRIAAVEQNSVVGVVDEGTVDEVGLSLVHSHLPRLADYDILEFDTRSGDVVTTDAFESLRPFLERSYRMEREGEPPSTSRLNVLYSDPPKERFLLDES